jgi:hypothetical protein
VLLEASGETATVHSFSDERKPFAEIPIGTIATSWTHPSNVESFLLLNYESLYFGDRIPSTLLCPNQMRNYGVVVEDTPRQYNGLSKHSIKTDEAEIGLDMDGVISYFESTKPTDAEIENSRRIVLTSDATWDPKSPDFATQELAFRDYHSTNVSSVKIVVKGFDLPELLTSEDLHHRLVLCLYVSLNDDDSHGLYSPDGRSILALSTSENKSVLTKETLAKRWGISLKAADTTIRASTQQGMLSFLHPIERRLPSSRPRH